MWSKDKIFHVYVQKMIKVFKDILKAIIIKSLFGQHF
jgi:hypothetical protein